MVAMRIEEELRRLEEMLLEPEVRRNSELVAALIGDDFVEFGSSGRVFDKAAILAELKDEVRTRNVILSEFGCRMLAEGIALITYRTTRRHEGGAVLGSAWRSSVWVNREGRWQLVFHQGTPSADDELK
jgi:hypothetical protein